MENIPFSRTQPQFWHSNPILHTVRASYIVLLLLAIVVITLNSCSTSVRFSSGGTSAPSGNTVGSNSPRTPASSSAKPLSSKERSAFEATNMLFRGMASYYGNEFQGRKTANGERYDQNELSAAHRTLPFGTMVRVRNTANDRSVVVRVNDRGPWKESRVLDVSYAAAKELDMTRSGTVPVEVTVLK